jgi:hypothetical protein
MEVPSTGTFGDWLGLESATLDHVIKDGVGYEIATYVVSFDLITPASPLA